MSAETRVPRGLAVATLALAALLASSGRAAEESSAGSAAVLSLMQRDLAGVSGKEVLVLTVEYGPGESSQPHRHDSNVFVYVLQGSVRMQVQGQKPVTLTAGQTFYEGPGDVHLVSANASATQPAKFLVFMVKSKGAPVTL